MVEVNSGGTPIIDLVLPSVNRESDTYLHEQVAANIRRAIASGEARHGERIPHAKDLAAVLGVNTNTVLRAIRLLCDEGLLETGRGKAITVSGTPEKSELLTRIRELVSLSNRLGYPKQELMQLIELNS